MPEACQYHLAVRRWALKLGPNSLPDGRVFQIRANSNTALYNPTTNTWTAGPTIPGGKGAVTHPQPFCPTVT